MECYRRFTALSAKHRKERRSVENTTSVSKSASLRSSTRTPTENNVLFPKICIFCDKKEFVEKGERFQLTKVVLKTNEGKFPFQESLTKYAEILNDVEMTAKISGLDLGAKEAWYHRKCRTIYQRKAGRVEEANAGQDLDSEWHQNRKLHADTFSAVCEFVLCNVIEKEGAYFLSELGNMYESILIENGVDNICYKNQKLEKKLISFFKERIVIGPSGKGNIIYSPNITAVSALNLVGSHERELEKKVREVAFYLRNVIRKTRKRPLPEELKLDDVLDGEIDIPGPLQSFYCHLIMGPRLERGETARKKRRVKFLSSDAIYAVTDGRAKPSKHLKLGLAVKKLTSSRKVLEILNRYGHVASYHTIEEIENELTLNATNRTQLTPFGMQMEPGLCTGLAIDNFDRYVETTSGKDTLHDTVGIAYQNVPCEGSNFVLNEASNTSRRSSNDEFDYSVQRKKTKKGNDVAVEQNQPDLTIQSVDSRLTRAPKRKRRFESNDADLEPYRKKPKMVCTISSNDTEKSSEPESYTLSVYKNLLWIFSLYFDPGKALMWTGWNAKGVSNNSKGQQQQVWYLPQINASPTSTTVVIETMRRALKIASEMKLQSIALSCDLAIAKLAYQIQATESPAFDAIFINLGAFHIELALFNAIGKYIAESGGPFILTESGVLASGSMTGFLKGKHYNRCKRVHMLFVAALQLLKLREFIKSNEEIEDKLEVVKNEVLKINEKPFVVDDLSKDLKELLDAYKKDTVGTSEGSDGCTAQYWIGYIEMVMDWLLLSRSIREGDLLLYTYSLKVISKYFFVFNQPNYARWLTEYHSKLLKIKDTHPEVEKQFKSGAIGVRRSGKNFSRIPIDLTLEQTINADAASQKTGINSFTNSISARQRWAKSHPISMTILTSILEDLGLSRKEDVSCELRPSRIKRNAKELQRIVTQIEQSMNPFSPELDKDSLFNIGSGKAASNETKEFLINVAKIGEDKQKEFMKECEENPSRFENEPITRTKMHTFASEGAKRKVKCNGQVKEVKMERDLFGKILCLSLEQNIDMQELLKYPLTPVPLVFCHYDGSLRDTPKSKLFNHLKNQVVSPVPSYIDAMIIDGNFYLHLLTEVPVTFGGISRKILVKLCYLKAPRIDLVFDQIKSPSIKDFERDQRAQANDRSLNYQISGPKQTRPPNFIQALRNDSFKDSLISFLTNSWNDDSFANIIGDKVLYVTHREKCFCYSSLNGKVQRDVIDSLQSSHEEADSRMFLHLHSMPEQSNVVIRSNDSDVLVIAVGLAEVLKSDVWIEHGFASDNSLEYVHVNTIITYLGTSVSQALPGLHAFTGCDYTPAFSGRGKVRPLKILLENREIQEAFISIGNGEVSDASVSMMEKFVCKLYGNCKRLSSVDEARYKLFFLAYKPKKDKPILSAKGISSISMPPCSTVLYQQIRRVGLISSTWLKAYENDPPPYSPQDNGFELVDAKYYPKWYDGDMVPPSVDCINIISTNENDADNDEDEISNDDEEDEEEDEDSGAEECDEF